jgi:hypothetical protein
MSDTFWKQKERRILRRWFNTCRIGNTGKRCPDGRTENMAIEVFTHPIPGWMLKELRQAEDDLRNSTCPNDFIPWAVFGPKNSLDRDMIIFTRLGFFPRFKGER